MHSHLICDVSGKATVLDLGALNDAAFTAPVTGLELMTTWLLLQVTHHYKFPTYDSYLSTEKFRSTAKQ